jgi:hypothetical protein
MEVSYFEPFWLQFYGELMHVMKPYFTYTYLALIVGTNLFLFSIYISLLKLKLGHNVSLIACIWSSLW